MTLVVILGLAVLIAVLYVSTYNGIVSKRNQAVNGYSQIDVQLKRKASLIPSLVETVKAYMGHEKDVLIRITEARTALLGAKGPAEAAQADHQLKSALSTLFVAVKEEYPQLQASDSFLKLQEELVSTENRVAYARQAYNDAVTGFHNALDTFPGNMIAGGKFQRMELYEIPATEREMADSAMVKF